MTKTQKILKQFKEKYGISEFEDFDDYELIHDIDEVTMTQAIESMDWQHEYHINRSKNGDSGPIMKFDPIGDRVIPQDEKPGLYFYEVKGIIGVEE